LRATRTAHLVYLSNAASPWYPTLSAHPSELSYTTTHCTTHQKKDSSLVFAEHTRLVLKATNRVPAYV